MKTELLESILDKECKSFILYDLIILGSLGLHQKSQLKKLEFYCVENIEILQEIISSCCSLDTLGRPHFISRLKSRVLKLPFFT